MRVERHLLRTPSYAQVLLTRASSMMLFWMAVFCSRRTGGRILLSTIGSTSTEKIQREADARFTIRLTPVREHFACLPGATHTKNC
jgi:hypothetical protein